MIYLYSPVDTDFDVVVTSTIKGMRNAVVPNGSLTFTFIASSQSPTLLLYWSC